MTSPRRRGDVAPIVRLLVGLVLGVVVAASVGWMSAAAAVLAGWATTAVVFVAWTWAAVFPMDAEQTAAHATREEPTRFGAHAIVLAAGLVSLAGVLEVVLGPDKGRALPTIAMLASVVGSWAAIHTVFALRYARLYLTNGAGGIDFHQDEPPRYSDFAYMAATVGMSFAISDTDLGSADLRRTALPHALMSYLFGTVIIALVISVIGGA